MPAISSLWCSRRQYLSRAIHRLVFRSIRTRLRRITRRKRLPLSQKQWRDAFDPQTGRLIDCENVIKRIRYGGVELKIRAEVWLFLLNFYHTESTEAERQEENSLRRTEYDDLKKRCISMYSGTKRRGSLGSERSLGTYQDSKVCDSSKQGSSQICTAAGVLNHDSYVNVHCKENVTAHISEEFGTWQRIMRLDAVRMNSEWVPYSPSQANVTKGLARQKAADVSLTEDEHLEPCVRHHAARLVTILEAYATYDPEIGYCQGMSDLLSPFVALLDDDYQAFWCFVHFMDTARDNFRSDEAGILRQLKQIAMILKVGDPQLFKHLEKIQAADCLFVYRMVVVLMRREFSFEQTISFWEILWADKTALRICKVKRRRKIPPADNLLLYVIAALVRKKRKYIIQQCTCMDDILRAFNSMAGKLDMWTLVDGARKLLVSLSGRSAFREK